MIFDEETCWPWNNPVHGEKLCVFQGLEDTEDEDAHEEDITQVTDENVAHEQHHLSDDEEQHHLVRYKSLKNIYESCSFILNVVDPESFFGVVSQPEWLARSYEV